MYAYVCAPFSLWFHDNLSDFFIMDIVTCLRKLDGRFPLEVYSMI